MANNIRLTVFPVKDIELAKSFYNAFFETAPYVDSPYYVGYKLDDLEIGLDPNGKVVVSYIDVDNIEESLPSLKDAGAEVVMASKEVGEGLRVAQIQIDGNVLGLREFRK